MGLYADTKSPIYGVKWIIFEANSMNVYTKTQYEYMTTNTQSLLHRSRGLTQEEKLSILNELTKEENNSNMHISIFTECYSTLDCSSMYSSTELVSRQWFPVSSENLKNYLMSEN